MSAAAFIIDDAEIDSERLHASKKITLKEEEKIGIEFKTYLQRTEQERHIIKLVVVLMISRQKSDGSPLPRLFDMLKELLEAKKPEDDNFLLATSETSDAGKLKMLILKLLIKDIPQHVMESMCHLPPNK
jgi:hypothetical protein